ncbi:MAG: TIGR03905 family TSCPD domain-containing protein [Oscillospiraceae bacterium]|nr:TIGR03905 family TSCPD domain-containing protein [Oscillospiraceae bacterium]
MKYTFRPGGVCAQEFMFNIEDGVVVETEITGGCPGSLAGISRLIVGMPVERVIECLEGLQCKDRGTSCPDQIAQALRESLKAE